MKHKRLYYTRYAWRFTSHVWADGIQAAIRLCEERKLGEKIVCVWHAAGALPQSPFDQPASRIMAEASQASAMYDLHALTFLAHLAISSGAATPAEFLSDTGILHEWEHLCLGLTSRKPARLRADILRRVRAVERKVPGYLP